MTERPKAVTEGIDALATHCVDLDLQCVIVFADGSATFSTNADGCLAGISDGLCASHPCPSAEAEIRRLRGELARLKELIAVARHG